MPPMSSCPVQTIARMLKALRTAASQLKGHAFRPWPCVALPSGREGSDPPLLAAWSSRRGACTACRSAGKARVRHLHRALDLQPAQFAQLGCREQGLPHNAKMSDTERNDCAGHLRFASCLQGTARSASLTTVCSRFLLQGSYGQSLRQYRSRNVSTCSTHNLLHPRSSKLENILAMEIVPCPKLEGVQAGPASSNTLAMHMVLRQLRTWLAKVTSWCLQITPSLSCASWRLGFQSFVAFR